MTTIDKQIQTLKANLAILENLKKTGTDNLIEQICNVLFLNVTEVLSESRRRHLVYARAIISYHLSEKGLHPVRIAEILKKSRYIIYHYLTIYADLIHVRDKMFGAMVEKVKCIM